MNEWISVKCSLPPEGEPCLLYQTYPEGTVFNMLARPLNRTSVRVGGMRWDGKFVSHANQQDKEGLQYVTHWMPLPKPPEEKQ